jgi:hypothetical protein
MEKRSRRGDVSGRADTDNGLLGLLDAAWTLLGYKECSPCALAATAGDDCVITSAKSRETALRAALSLTFEGVKQLALERSITLAQASPASPAAPLAGGWICGWGSLHSHLWWCLARRRPAESSQEHAGKDVFCVIIKLL